MSETVYSLALFEHLLSGTAYWLELRNQLTCGTFQYLELSRQMMSETVIRTIHNGDCLLVGIDCTIDFMCCPWTIIVWATDFGRLYWLELSGFVLDAVHQLNCPDNGVLESSTLWNWQLELQLIWSVDCNTTPKSPLITGSGSYTFIKSTSIQWGVPINIYYEL